MSPDARDPAPCLPPARRRGTDHRSRTRSASGHASPTEAAKATARSERSVPLVICFFCGLCVFCVSPFCSAPHREILPEHRSPAAPARRIRPARSRNHRTGSTQPSMGAGVLPAIPPRGSATGSSQERRPGSICKAPMRCGLPYNARDGRLPACRSARRPRPAPRRPMRRPGRRRTSSR